MKHHLFVLSLGGSLINPGEVDIKFLKEFKNLIEREVRKGHRFIIVAGGGKPARWYQGALKQLGTTTSRELDWMGIFATQLNAQLLRLMFGALAHSAINGDPTKKVQFKAKILLAAGWEPGWSTDFDAVELAKTYGAKTIVNLSNIDKAYTKDPNTYKDARPITQISWPNFRKIVGNRWNPGANTPFDPIASKLAEKNKLRVIIANGKNLRNLQNILNDRKFVGTVIE